ncbi:class D sortase [Pygmaiobacter massiliensis]|uniref:class D sortase n=1 Tax=Pygmaiobacter massiliensis TaxID=1917873 RepID=UPI000C7973C4|nr:class D sortase [Pygmaiobacter massiliensis]
MLDKTQKTTVAQYVFIPILFLAITLTLLFFTAKPVVEPYLSLANYLFVDLPHAQPADLFSDLSQNIAKNGKVSRSAFEYPDKGDLYGQITIEGTSVDAPLYYGDSNRELNRGVGTYADDAGVGIPGDHKTVLLAGHCSTFFNGLQDVQIGDIVSVRTHYGEYTYRVQDMGIKDYRDPTAYDFSKTEENLILYTCYPFTALGFVKERYFIYGEYASGPMIDYES